MASQLRVCLYNADTRSDEPFRPPFEHLNCLQVVAECTHWQQLQTLLSAAPIDAVIVNLDDSRSETGSPLIVQQIAELAPGCGIVGVSRNAHPDTIIAAMRAGCHQFVRWPIDPVDLAGAIDRIRHTRLTTETQSQRCGVISASGGAGASTLVCNLAIELAHVTRQSVALVDMDLQFGDVACAFDARPRYSVADVCCTSEAIDTTVLEAGLEALPCGVSILGRPEDVEQAEVVNPDAVDDMFRMLAKMYPYVLVDLPRYMPPPARACLAGTDRILIVSQLTVPHLRNASRIYEQLLKQGAIEDRIDLVLNRCNANFERISPQEVEKHFGRPVLSIIPNDYKNLGAARDLGRPVMSDAPHSPARLAIKALARELAGQDATARPRRPKRGGVFGWFRGRNATVGAG